MKINQILKNKYSAGIIIGIIALAAGALIYGLAATAKEKSSWLPEDKIAEAAKLYINSELIQQGEATVKVIGKEGGLYKLEVNYNGQKIDSYMTKDGKRLFPQSFEIATKEADKKDSGSAGSGSNTATNDVAKKSDKPSVELFVMSHCPYGTQIEKGIIPVVEKLGEKIDFQLKFVDYAMHGEKELKEQLNQYCIQKEQKPKLLSYLKCFLQDGNSENCISQTGLDTNKLKACAANADKKFKVLDNFKNQVGFKGSNPGFDIFKADNEKYGVGGSPTLVINGSQNQSGRDSNSLLKAICSAFNNVPKECSDNLSSDTPAPGFGGGSAPAGNSGTGGCH